MICLRVSCVSAACSLVFCDIIYSPPPQQAETFVLVLPPSGFCCAFGEHHIESSDHQLRSFGRCPVWIVRRTYRMLPLNRRQDLRLNSRMLFEPTFHLSFPPKPTP